MSGLATYQELGRHFLETGLHRDFSVSSGTFDRLRSARTEKCAQSLAAGVKAGSVSELPCVEPLPEEVPSPLRPP